MGSVNAREILLKATESKYAIGAFNVTSIIQMIAIVKAAEEMKSPLIIQTSESPAKMMGPEVVTAAYRVLADKADIPIVLHLDHCTNVDFCKRCIDAGYTSIMMDASEFLLEENIKLTREVVEYAGKRGNVTVEGELGTVCGVEDQVIVAEDEAKLCDPETAMTYVKDTGIDLLAPAIGTAHGVYKTDSPKIDVDRLAKIKKNLDNAGWKVPLVVHGGTGLSEEIVQRLIKAGGSKYNVSTELKYAWIDSAVSFLKENKDIYNPGKLFKEQMKSSGLVVKKWIAILGSSNKA